jgi:hypothetical protein
MDARGFPSRPALLARRGAQIAAVVLVLLTASALWRGFGAWLWESHVH